MQLKNFSLLLSSLFIVLTPINLIAQSAIKSHTIDFESFNLSDSTAFYGPTENAISVPGNYGGQNWVGTIEVGGVNLSNNHSDSYGSWSGFAISRDTDSQTEGWTNQFSSITGNGAAGSQQYAVAFGYHDSVANAITEELFEPTNSNHLRGLPSIYLPTGTSLLTFDVTNTTYTALSMQYGDGFTKMFGGTSGFDPDFLQLNIYGMDVNGNPIANHVQVMLADFTFLESEMDFILKDWLTVDVTSMSEAASFHFNLVSSDNGPWGMNTPAYFALDNLNVAAVPEPTTLVLCGAGLCLTAGVRRLRKASKG